MSDVVSFTELHGQHVELLPGRTMLQASGPYTAPIDDVLDDGGSDGTGGFDDNGGP
ncbi:MAG: hypothetical protein ACRDTF_15390 [Pseudonocardiaceae bacterium]